MQPSSPPIECVIPQALGVYSLRTLIPTKSNDNPIPRRAPALALNDGWRSGLYVEYMRRPGSLDAGMTKAVHRCPITGEAITILVDFGTTCNQWIRPALLRRPSYRPL